MEDFQIATLRTVSIAVCLVAAVNLGCSSTQPAAPPDLDALSLSIILSNGTYQKNEEIEITYRLKNESTNSISLCRMFGRTVAVDGRDRTFSASSHPSCIQTVQLTPNGTIEWLETVSMNLECYTDSDHPMFESSKIFPKCGVSVPITIEISVCGLAPYCEGPRLNHRRIVSKPAAIVVLKSE